jgi:hypothetical protein
MRNDDLEHAVPGEPMQALDRPILLATLRSEEGVADEAAYSSTTTS